MYVMCSFIQIGAHHVHIKTRSRLSNIYFISLIIHPSFHKLLFICLRLFNLSVSIIDFHFPDNRLKWTLTRITICKIFCIVFIREHWMDFPLPYFLQSVNLNSSCWSKTQNYIISFSNCSFELKRQFDSPQFVRPLFSLHQMCNLMKCGTRRQIPKRIKSVAHLIVNCNIKPNWIPITSDRIYDCSFRRDSETLHSEHERATRNGQFEWKRVSVWHFMSILELQLFEKFEISPTCCNVTQHQTNASNKMSSCGCVDSLLRWKKRMFK